VIPLRIIITAGPTIEPIDPVRFLSNRSTGYMGYELARCARKRKHRVILISGPTCLKRPAGVRFTPVETASEMQKAVRKEIRKADALVMASAVADFRPSALSKKKIKSAKGPIMKLVKNQDILKSLNKKDRKGRVIAGFALETGNLLKNAVRKLKEKSLDFIVANKASGGKTPFGKGLKTAYIIKGPNHIQKLERINKTGISRAILDTVEELCYTPR